VPLSLNLRRNFRVIGENMRDTTKQTQVYALMLALTTLPVAERQNVIRGAAVFFDRGWPSDHFTVGMAALAGMGLVPPIYGGIGTEELYFLSMQDRAESFLIEVGETEETARV
jgi:hypothetical protein